MSDIYQTHGRGQRYGDITRTVGDTPCVKLNRIAPDHVDIYVKVESFNPLGSVKDRLALNIIEAAEQCDRLDIPKIYDLTSLKDFMAKLSTETLILADESGAGVTIDSLYKQHHNLTGLIILIGPEGGFSKEERDYIRSYQYSCSLNLGPRILRADTAVISSLALINNYYGDIELKPKFMV